MFASVQLFANVSLPRREFGMAIRMQGLCSSAQALDTKNSNAPNRT